MPAPLRPIIPGDWMGLEQVIKDLWAIVNADTTLSGMTSDTTAISSDLDIAESNILWMESDIDTNTSDIVVLKSDIDTNTSDLLVVAASAGSSSDVATNTSDIVVLKSDIAAEKSDTVIFKSNLLWMESDIDTNTSDLKVVSDALFAIGDGVAGNNTEVQVNVDGALGGNANFTFDDATNTMAVSGIITTTRLLAGGVKI